MENFLGELKLVPFNFAPKGWAFCGGQLLSIAQNQALFALLGTDYGGDGVRTFGLPDLRDRAVLGAGHGDGLSNYNRGQFVGADHVTLTISQIPAHDHTLMVSGAAGDQTSPVGHYPAVSTSGMGYLDGDRATNVNNNAVTSAGGGQAHTNRQPYLVLNYIIALQGIFPSRN